MSYNIRQNKQKKEHSRDRMMPEARVLSPVTGLRVRTGQHSELLRISIQSQRGPHPPNAGKNTWQLPTTQNEITPNR